MKGRYKEMRTFGLSRIVGLLLLVTGVAAYGYNAGVANGLAQAGGTAAAAPAFAPHVFFGPLLFFGFFGFLLKLLFIGFLIRLALGFFWHGRGGPWGGRRFGRGFGDHGVPPRFEEWHRRSHESPPTVGPL
jgi:hypothetical protein